jgi:hypothetical protein
MILIIDDAVSKNLQDEYEAIVTDKNFNWFLAQKTVREEDAGYAEDPNEMIVPFMYHTIIKRGEINSSLWDLTSKILSQVEMSSSLKIESLINVRLNLQFANGHPDKHNGIHVDGWDDDNLTALYYINDSDGDTHFFDEDKNIIKRVSPKKGRFVVFDNQQLHASQSPINYDKRIIINWNMTGTYEV